MSNPEGKDDQQTEAKFKDWFGGIEFHHFQYIQGMNEENMAYIYDTVLALDKAMIDLRKFLNDVLPTKEMKEELGLAVAKKLMNESAKFASLGKK